MFFKEHQQIAEGGKHIYKIAEGGNVSRGATVSS